MKTALFLCLGILIGDVLHWLVRCICTALEEEENSPSTTPFSCPSFFTKESILTTRIFSSEKKGSLIFHLAIDITTGLLTVLILTHFSATSQGMLALLLTYTLIVLSFIDLKTQLLPDIFTKPLIILGLIQGYFGIFCTLQEAVLGTLIGYFSLWSINTLFRLIRKKEGMGYGDFKLFAALGAWLGVEQLLLVFILAPVMGILTAFLNTAFSGSRITEPSPFGPSLAIAGMISLLYGDTLLAAYLGLFR